VPTAGVVIIGDEILTGKFTEENARFLIGAFPDLGVDLRRITVIPDDLEDIAATVPELSRRFDHVFTSGGVGPTHDDLTMAGIARGFGVDVVRVPELEAKVRAYWGEKLALANLRLADAPRGYELVYGKDQVWPVVCVKNVYILPGVPALFRRKFLDIRDRFRSAPATVARLYVMADEGELAPHLDAVVAAYPGVKLGSYPRFDEKDFRVILTLESKDAAAVGAAQDALAERIGAKVVRKDAPREAGGAQGQDIGS
jgi:molybdenum cofactor synthesis domain-containing protein